jgi:hypothetical protein
MHLERFILPHNFLVVLSSFSVCRILWVSSAVVVLVMNSFCFFLYHGRLFSSPSIMRDSLLDTVISVGSYFLSGFEIHHFMPSLLLSFCWKTCNYSDGFDFIDDMVLSFNFQYSFLVLYTYHFNYNMIHGGFFFFCVLKASCTWMTISGPSIRKFSSLILLNMFSISVTYTSSPSSMPIIHSSGF